MSEYSSVRIEIHIGSLCLDSTNTQYKNVQVIVCVCLFLVSETILVDC